MNEAKASFNGYFRSPGGNKDQFTLRQADNQSDKEFIARVKQFVKLLGENGWKEWLRPEDTDALENPSSPRSPSLRSGSGQAPGGSLGTGSKQEARSLADGANGTGHRPGKTFELESIQLAAGGEHPRWVVKGGKFKKFGVTCWPETLEAAGIAEALDPLKENKPKGHWVARYTERQNEEGRWVPDKVTQIVKAKSKT
ncbi:MAG: hypothetical protein M1347_05735 [Chloroflexi bacterium]|nr:hypothetical protein [Chloroflexota bacterium]